MYQFYQSPSGPVSTNKTLQVFRIYKDCLIWTWKYTSKLPGKKKKKKGYVFYIPSRTNLRRYISYTRSSTKKIIISIYRCIHHKNRIIPMKTPPWWPDLPPTPREVAGISSWRNTQICSLRDSFRCCCCSCLSWSACGHAARLISTRTKPHRYWYCCRQPTITLRPVPATADFPAAECTRLLCRATCPT